MDASHSMLVNCTLADNSAADTSGGQAAFVGSGALAVIYNSILYSNNWGPPSFPAPIVGLAAVESSDVQQLSGTYSGFHNINADPNFRRLSLGVLTLINDPLGKGTVSPCLDRADYTKLPPDNLDVNGDGDFMQIIPIDLNTDRRWTDLLNVPNLGVGYPGCTLSTCAGYLDMGAYEHP